MRGLASSRLALLVVLACVAFPSSAAAARSTYDYAMTLEGDGAATFDYTGGCCHEYGDEAGTYKLTYEVVIVIDDERKTVTVGGSPTAKTLEGLSTFHYRSTCADPSCTGPDTVCNWDNVPVGQQYLSAQQFYLSAQGQYGSTDYGAFTNGAINLEQLVGGVGPGGAPIPCSGTSKVDYPTWEKMPGIKGTFSIPVARLGERHFVLTQSSDPSYAANTYTPTANWQYTLTFDLLNLRVSEAKLDFADRASRRAQRLRDTAIRLDDRKVEIENDILAESQKAQKLQQVMKRLDPKLDAVHDAIADSAAALKRLKNAQGDASAETRGLLENEERLADQVARLEQRVLAAERDGKDASGLTKRLRSARLQLDAVEDVLKDKYRGDELGELRSRWLKRLRTLQGRLFDLLDEQAKLIGDLGATDARLTALASELREVDSALLDVAQALSRFDPEVREITGRVAGQTVFHAVAAYGYADLLRLNDEIAEQQKLIDEAKGAKAVAYASFKRAATDALESHKRLAALLKRLAYERFAVDLAFDSYDIIKATAKGGVVGAAAELGKKYVEKLVKEYAGETNSGFDPGSLEAQINRELGAGLKDPYSKPQLARVVSERILKDTAFKATKDTLNQYLGQLVFDKVEAPFRKQLTATALAVVGNPAADTRKLELAKRLGTQLESLQKGYLNNFATNKDLKKFFKGEGENLVKDSLKTIIKGALSKAETDAWRDFFIRDGFARLAYKPYHDAADVWENRLARKDQLLEEKAKLLGGANDGELTTDVSVSFQRSAELQIELNLGHADPDDPVHVFVNGAEATRNTSAFGNVYTINPESITPGPDGTLTVTLR